MDIFPAIDLRGGQVVRLKQGNPAAQTTFSDNPAAMAHQWSAQGARWLHVVNLDGAFSGDTTHAQINQHHANLVALQAILRAVNTPLQFGGGVRDLASIAYLLGLGVTRVILGTIAVQNPALVGEALNQFGAEKIVVGLDAKAGMVATHGWQTTSTLRADEVAVRMRELGARHIVFTDIARDGMLQGVNVAATRALAQASGLKVIASGGVASLADIQALKAVEGECIEGVIIGQALYTGAVQLSVAIHLAEAD